jgi:hypothetical protein
MVYFELFVCWNLFCTIANLRIKFVTETKNVSVLIYKNLKSSFLHDSHIWLWCFFTLLVALAHGAPQRIWARQGPIFYPKFFDRLFLIRVYWDPKSRQGQGLGGLASCGGPEKEGWKQQVIHRLNPFDYIIQICKVSFHIV